MKTMNRNKEKTLAQKIFYNVAAIALLFTITGGYMASPFLPNAYGELADEDEATISTMQDNR